MKPALVLLAIAAILGSSGARTAFAQLNNGQQQSVVAVHVQAHDTKGLECSDFDPNLPCDRFVSYWPVGSGADVYFVVARADSALGVYGVSLGVDYGNTPGVQSDGQGVDVFGYASCADLEYTNGVDPGDPSTEFPSAGGGNRLIWSRTTNCQRHVVNPWGVEAVACAFYVYAYGRDEFIVDMNRNLYTGPEFQIVDCVGPAPSDMMWPEHAGYVDFGGGSGYNPCPGAPFYPSLVGASGNGGSNVVNLRFNAPIDGGWFFAVYPTADPASPLGVAGTSGSGTGIALILTSNLAGGVSYTVKASIQTEEPGLPIYSTYAHFVAGGESIPPTLVSASGGFGESAVTVTFSEPVGAGADVSSNYTVYPTADPSSPLGVTGASVSEAQVILTLASSLAETTSYTVAVSNVEDLWGNTIAPNSTVEFTPGGVDVTPPTLAGAQGFAGSNLVTLTFSEPVGAGADEPGNYRVFRTSTPESPFPVLSVVVSGIEVTLTVSGTLGPSTAYTVAVSNVADAAGNVIAAGSTVDFTTGAGGGAGDQSQSMVAVHAQSHDAKGVSCGGLDPDLPCGRFTTNWPVRSSADVYMVVALADPIYGVSGVSLGVTYGSTPGVKVDHQGCDVFGYVSCADLEYTNGIDPDDTSTEFPASGGGNRLIWVRTNNCQMHVVPPYGVQVVACAFYVYAYGPDRFSVDMNRNLVNGPEFQIVDCPGPALSDMPFPEHAGYVGFGDDPGYNPCPVAVPTVRTTWGKLKTQYR
jgi:hypothetical protein